MRIGRRRSSLALLGLLALSGFGIVAWTLAGLAPVGMIWRYGLDHSPEPTGQVKTIEGLEFVEIGPGCFRMGSDHLAEGGDWLGLWCARLGLPWGDQPGHSGEMPVHWVEFPRGFFIARTEVTNAQYEAFAPDHERSEDSPGDRYPVVEVSWEDAKKYCAWLSERSGLAIRLPSESEWECACRAGSKREFCFGDDEKLIDEYAWYGANSDDHAHEVGTRRANAWGLHDLPGNVWEWCEDSYLWGYEGAPSDGSAWVGGAEERDDGAQLRILRGGSFADLGKYCRSASRAWLRPEGQDPYQGFRPAFLPLDP